jgi:hypothetical protein
MPKLEEHPSAKITKLLLLGDSGAGKTGSLISLVKAGYNLRILDFDNGIDILSNMLRGDKAGLSRVDYVTCTDTFKSVNNKLVPTRATAWTEAVKYLTNWPGLGSTETWTDKDVLVIDSLTLMGQAAMRYVLSMNGRLGGRREQSDWFDAQNLQEDMCAHLYSDAVKCNVIVISHITYLDRPDGSVSGYASALGKALPPKIGRYFNAALMVKRVGTKRMLMTSAPGLVELKAPKLSLPTQYPIETGLADYFKAVRE